MLTKINLRDTNAKNTIVSEENSWLDFHQPFEDLQQVVAMEHNVDTSLKALDVAINHYENLKDKENVSQEELAVYNNFLIDVYKTCGISEENYTDSLVVSEEGIIDGIKNVITAVFEFIKKIFQWIGDMIGKFIDWLTGLFNGSSSSKGGGSSAAAISSKAKETGKLEEEVKSEGKEDEYKEELKKIVKERELNETTLLAIWCFNKAIRKNLTNDTVNFDIISNIDASLGNTLETLVNTINFTAKILSTRRKDLTNELDCRYIEDIKKVIDENNPKNFTKNLNILGLSDIADKLNTIANGKYKNKLLYIKLGFTKFTVDEITVESVVRGLSNKTKEIRCGISAPKTSGLNDKIAEPIKINKKLKVNLDTTLSIKDIEYVVNKTIEDKLDKYHMGVVDSFRNVKSIVEEYNKKVNGLKDLKIDFSSKKSEPKDRAVKKFIPKFLQIYKEHLKTHSVDVTNLILITQKLVILEETYLREIKNSYLEILKAKELAAKKVLNKSKEG